MLRHYDGLGLVRPSGRTASGYRDYSDDDVQRLFQVEALRSIGLPLSQIGRALESPGAASDAAVAELKRAARLRAAQALELLDKLTAIEEGGPTRWEEVLRAIELMKELDSRSGARRQQRVLTQSFEDAIPVGILVRALVSEEDPHVAGALRWAIARLGASGLAALGEAARSPDVSRRRRAVEAITEMAGSPEALAVLGSLLADPDPTVRRCAAVALGRRGDASALPALVGLIVEGDHDVEAAEALRALAARAGRDDGVVRALVELLEEPATTRPSRIRLAQALVEIGTPAAREALAALSGDPDPQVAGIAAVLVERDPGQSG